MKKSLLLVPLILVLQGCGVTMTSYEPSYANVQQLKEHAPLQAVDRAQVQAGSGQGSLTVRANPVRSPSGSIPQHIQEAINDELGRAGLLDAKSQRHLDVLVVKSNLTAGMATGDGELGARFTLSRSGQVVYDETKYVTRTWNSSFFGPIAIPAAANAYNPMVQDLLKSLYSDPLFIQAMK
ncbi:hypothetical protein [Pseudomonas sp. zfem002]|uniref:hypothetical protein n=1 Tax=Pseudomonas sp. zfem002 TaxID=3078197 RepID=UPI0029282C07|nr:hypothetical protein [Pseudomonas sp. zfem002]MDU9394058.1 hypothetical protein [Pseudomonas sp. zfem002]